MEAEEQVEDALYSLVLEQGAEISQVTRRLWPETESHADKSIQWHQETTVEYKSGSTLKVASNFWSSGVIPAAIGYECLWLWDHDAAKCDTAEELEKRVRRSPVIGWRLSKEISYKHLMDIVEIITIDGSISWHHGRRVGVVLPDGSIAGPYGERHSSVAEWALYAHQIQMELDTEAIAERRRASEHLADRDDKVPF